MGKRGYFITFEGGEGCGKTTQSTFAKEYLDSLGYDVLQSREPGGTTAGEAMRNHILFPPKVKLSPLAQLFGFSTARITYVDEIVAPNLEKGVCVLSDRYCDSSFAYQGAGGVDKNIILKLNEIATREIMPDLTLIYDLTDEQILERLNIAKKVSGRDDRFELKGYNFHKKVRDNFREISELFPERIKVVSFDDINKMYDETQGHLDNLIKNK